MSWIFENDITWCYNSSRIDGEYGCNHTDCFRHLSNLKTDGYTLCSMAYLKNTPTCPHFKEGK